MSLKNRNSLILLPLKNNFLDLHKSKNSFKVLKQVYVFYIETHKIHHIKHKNSTEIIE